MAKDRMGRDVSSFAAGFSIKVRDLNDAEKAHLKAVEDVAERMYSVLKGNSPDLRCMAIAIEHLESCVLWARKSILIGAHL